MQFDEEIKSFGEVTSPVKRVHQYNDDSWPNSRSMKALLRSGSLDHAVLPSEIEDIVCDYWLDLELDIDPDTAHHKLISILGKSFRRRRNWFQLLHCSCDLISVLLSFAFASRVDLVGTKVLLALLVYFLMSLSFRVHRLRKALAPHSCFSFGLIVLLTGLFAVIFSAPVLMYLGFESLLIVAGSLVSLSWKVSVSLPKIRVEGTTQRHFICQHTDFWVNTWRALPPSYPHSSEPPGGTVGMYREGRDLATPHRSAQPKLCGEGSKRIEIA